MKIPISIRGWLLSSSTDRLNQSTRSFIQPGVQRVWLSQKRRPGSCRRSPKASTWFVTLLVFAAMVLILGTVFEQHSVQVA